MKSFEVTIEGISPLLQARHPSEAEEAEIKQRSSKDGKKVKKVTDKEMMEIHAYKKKGKYFQPGEMIEAAMVKAATGYRIEGQGKKTYKDLFKAGVFIDPVEIVHKNQDFYMDARWGKNPSTRGAVWVVRPCIDEWVLDFKINIILDEKIPEEVIKNVLIDAGIGVGIGAWRPKFGRFEVKKFKELETKTK